VREDDGLVFEEIASTSRKLDLGSKLSQDGVDRVDGAFRVIALRDADTLSEHLHDRRAM
jgi:hypothetical protein